MPENILNVLGPNAVKELDSYFVPPHPNTIGQEKQGLQSTFGFSWSITEMVRLFGVKQTIAVMLDTIQFTLEHTPKDDRWSKAKPFTFEELVETLSEVNNLEDLRRLTESGA